MRVLALGCGDMGRLAVSALLTSKHVSHVTVVDKNEQLVDAFVQMVGSHKLSGHVIDVMKKEELENLMASNDLIINTIGPFFKFGKKIFKSVILTKKSYIDICDDWKPTLELLELNNKAKEAGITAIIGMGASPGILNLLAVIASSRLNKVDEVVTAWGLGNTDRGPKIPYYISRKKMPENQGASAVYQHLLHQCTGMIPTFKGSEKTYIQALTESEPLEIPGFNSIYAAHIGHPEPVTLPRIIKANSISNVVYYGKRIIELLREYGKELEQKKTTLIEATKRIEKEFVEVLSKDDESSYLLRNFPMELCVIATGETSNKEKKRIIIGLARAPYGGMAGITGIPLAIAAQMIIEGKIMKKGVLTPEEAINPNEFFERFASFCGENLKVNDILFEKEIVL